MPRCVPCLLLLSMVMTSSIRAQEKTYSGRTFDEWKVLAIHDLEFDTRVKAATALGFLGEHGYEDEALAVLTVMIETDSHHQILQAAYRSISKLGDASIPVLITGLKSEEPTRQSLVLAILASSSISNTFPTSNLADQALPTLVELFAQHIAQEPAIEDRTERQRRILEQMRNGENPDVIGEQLAALNAARAAGFNPKTIAAREARSFAARAIRSLLAGNATERQAEFVLPKLMTAAKSDDTELACLALQTMGALGEFAKPAIPLLIENLSVEDWQTTRRGFPAGIADPRNQAGIAFEGRGAVGFATSRSSRSSTDTSRSLAAASSIITLGSIAAPAEAKLKELCDQANVPAAFHEALESVRANPGQH